MESPGMLLHLDWRGCAVSRRASAPMRLAYTPMRLAFAPLLLASTTMRLRLPPGRARASAMGSTARLTAGTLAQGWRGSCKARQRQDQKKSFHGRTPDASLEIDQIYNAPLSLSFRIAL